MRNQNIVNREEWLKARKEHLVKEKEFTRLRDQLSQERRELPWVRVDKEYLFDGSEGKEGLSELFQGTSQLIVYHFMFHPDWDEGCPSCSFWADNFNGIDIHLKHRDTSFVAISRAPLKKLEAYKQRMGWNFKWLSSSENDFNFDYHVSFTPEQIEKEEVTYNYDRPQFMGEELPGISVFYKDWSGSQAGNIFHTYSCYARGLDMLNGAYHYLDLTPEGRDEDGLPYSMEWLRRHDQYDDPA